MKTAQLTELLLQSLTHERGGVLIYETALRCGLNADLRREWTKYLEQTKKHVRFLTDLCAKLGIDAGELTPGCKVVEHTGKSLVRAMQMALAEGNRAAAELVACEAVVLAETKDHLNWELIGECADALQGPVGQALRAAHDEIEPEEDEHLYHTQGWARELWLKSLGLGAVLPPPEEQDVKSAAQAERARQATAPQRGAL